LEFERPSKATRSNAPSFPDVQVHIVDVPLGAGPESILPVVVMDSGLALRAPRNDGSQLNCFVRFASRNDEWGNSDNGDVTIGAVGLH